MRELALTILIAVAIQTPAHAQAMPTLPSLTYPAPGTFCGMMTLCTPKATAPADRLNSVKAEAE